MFISITFIPKNNKLRNLFNVYFSIRRLISEDFCNEQHNKYLKNILLYIIDINN
jgi:hypothetical protein